MAICLSGHIDYEETKRLIENNTPDILINAAAKVGGIYANNSKRTEFILENLKVQKFTIKINNIFSLYSSFAKGKTSKRIPVKIQFNHRQSRLFS